MKQNVRNVVALFVAVALIAAACGSDSDANPAGAEPDSTDESTTTAAGTDSDTLEESTTTTAGNDSVDDSTTTSSDDSAAPDASSTGLEVVAVDFAAGIATVANNGSEAVDLAGHQLCNRPTYVPLPSQTLGTGESIDVSIGGLTQDGGEVGLYSSADFGSSDALVDYVTWGTGGGRLSVAEEAGQWTGSPATAEGDSLTLIGASGAADGWG